MNLYFYNAIVKENYDGDTVTVDIDLGFGVWLYDQRIRLYGVDTPEIRGEEREEGLKVKNKVEELVKGKNVLLESHKDKSGMYGRWLAKVHFDKDGEKKELTEFLLENDLAKKYD